MAFKMKGSPMQRNFGIGSALRKDVRMEDVGGKGMHTSANFEEDYRKKNTETPISVPKREVGSVSSKSDATISKPKETVEAPKQSKYREKKTTRTGLFGRKREVTKYFDRETGKKLGKEVKITKKGYEKPVKVKTKKTSLGDPSVIGKWNVKEGYFRDGDNKATTPDSKPKVKAGKLNKDKSTKKPSRPDFAASKNELKEFVSKDKKTGDNKLKTYNQAWDDGRFKVEGGKRTDKFGNVYSDDAKGKADFVKASKKYWSSMAEKTDNENLLVDSQTGKKQGPLNKKRGFKMNSPLKNYRNPRDYKVFNMGNEASSSFKKKKKY